MDSFYNIWRVSVITLSLLLPGESKNRFEQAVVKAERTAKNLWSDFEIFLVVREVDENTKRLERLLNSLPRADK